MKIIECTQGSAEWLQIRTGIPTASEFHRIITPKTAKPSTQADGYIDRLIAESIRTGAPEPAWMSDAMRHGLMLEPEARRFYMLERNLEPEQVREVGFCISDCGRYGCSPDGLVGEDGGLELKCPTPEVHIGYLRAGTLPDEYKAQVHGQLLVTGRKWVDFLSYSVERLRPLLIRVYRDDFTTKLQEALEAFLGNYLAARRQVLGETSETVSNGN